MNPMQATKTLIIGLGSTGTRVCNNVIRRLEWEYGGLEKAPWVRFLAIETNSNEEATTLKARGDFISLGMDAAAYKQITSNPEGQHKIGLTRWADMETLRKLKAIDDGAGNIRMVGRLAFLHEPNFKKVKLALIERIASLNKLGPDDAMQARGTLADGTSPPVLFESDGHVRVFVVGTLCGGTGSGLLPDFGYFLRTLLKDEEKIIGVFTIPHPGLSPVITANANRLKRNAYHALMELNHYHQTKAQDLPEIPYPDGTKGVLQKEPYDLPYLVAPDATTKEAEAQLNELVADRIFVNIVNPATDPFSKSVDAPMPDRDHQAHVFCTFGLSVVEYPAPQVVEACAKRLLYGTLKEWQQNKAGRASDPTAALGLDWQSLVGSLLQRSPDEWQADELRVCLQELGQAKPDFSKLGQALGQLRRQVDLGGALTDTLRSRRDQVVETAYLKLRARVRQMLLDRTYGPQVLASELDSLAESLRGLKQAADDNAGAVQGEVAEKWSAVDKAVSSYQAELKRKSFLNPNRAGIEGAQRALRRSLTDYASVQLEASVYDAIRTHQTYGTIDPGVAEMMLRLLDRVRSNLRQLDSRITALGNQLFREYEDRANQTPPVNGLALFEPHTTVKEEYERSLMAVRKSSVEDLSNIEARLHDELVSAWTELPDDVAPPAEQLSDSWIAANFDPKGPHLIPGGVYQRLLGQATRPFVQVVAQENVIERLDRQMRANASAGLQEKVRSAAQRSRPFLTLDAATATQGNRSPINDRSFLLLPPSTPSSEVDDFSQLVSSAFPLVNVDANLKSPDPTRVMFLTEWYRFPLRGLPAVLGDGGLHAAESSDFPTFHTRRDVNWYGLSQREGQLLADAEEAIVLGVLLGELSLQGGLRMSWTPSGFGDRDFRLLPARLADAARLLAKGEKDRDGYSLTGALPTLQARIEQHWKPVGMTVEAGSAQFVRELDQRLSAFYQQYPHPPIEGWGDQRWAGEHLSKFSARHKPLLDAYLTMFVPDQAHISNLMVAKNTQGRWGGVAPDDGLYCPDCGGFIGKDVQDAARNGWRCFINPEQHYHGPQLARSAS